MNPFTHWTSEDFENEQDAEERLRWLSRHQSKAMYVDRDGLRWFGDTSAPTWRELSEKIP